MTRLLKTSFLWQFAGGFLIGAAGMVAMNAGATAAPATPYALAAGQAAAR